MLIGLIGAKGAGKSTIAEYLMRGYRFREYAFAEPLKQLCGDLFNLSDAQLYGDQKEVLDERWNTTPRILFQKVGTELFRKQLKKEIPDLNCDNIWIKRFELWYEEHSAEHCVVSDCRFSDEIKSVKDRGGIIVIIHRDLQETDQHASEQIHKNYEPDYHVYNNDNKEVLFEQINELINTLKHNE